MTVKLSVLIPDDTINYILNPSLRYNTDNWNAEGSTISRTLDRARFNVAGLKVITDGVALNEGTYSRVSALAGIIDVVTVSAYVRGAGTVRIRLDDNAPGGREYISQDMELNDDRWQRIAVTGRSHGGNDLRLYVETAEDSVAARTFYVDGAQLERKPYPTTFCDGDQEGCRWEGLWQASASSRKADTRVGGRWYQVSGPEREHENLYMTVAGGLGMAPLTNNTQDFAFQPGAYHQGVKIGTRVMTLNFHAKVKRTFINPPESLERLHDLRQVLIDLIKPDRTPGDEEILFEYDAGTIPMYFSARYDGGLEGDWDVRNRFINSFPLRLLAVNPLLKEDSQEAQELDFQDTILVNYAFGRIDGRWSNLNFGFDDGTANDGGAIGLRGELYMLGFDDDFTTINNNASAVDPLQSGKALVYWDGTKWNQIGVPTMGGGGAWKVLPHPDGKIYVCGAFTSIGGVAANRVAYWDGSTWNALGTGFNGECRGMALAPNGDIYFCGAFTTADGKTVNYITRWDGGTFHELGDYKGLNSACFSVDVNKDGTLLYVSGIFTDENGNPGTGLTRVAGYNIGTGKFFALGDGFDSRPDVIRISPEGIVHAGGSFEASGSETVEGVARFINGQWEALGNSRVAGSSVNNYILLSSVFSISFTPSGNIVVSGIFDRNGNYNVDIPIAIWNGATWTHPDISMRGGNCGVVKQNGDLFFGRGGGFGVGEDVRVSAINTVDNPGTASTYPVYYVKGPGYLRWIENQTTSVRMYLNILLDDGEELTIDVGRGTIGSTLRPNLFAGLLPGSDFRNFTLAPGENKIACLMVDDVNAEMSIQFTPTHWSVDATGKGSES